LSLGTTITAFIASLGGSNDGKRVAMMQVAINIIGITIGVILFYPSIKLTTYIGAVFSSSDISFLIALYMTMLKVTLVLLIFPFRKRIAQTTFKVIKKRFADIEQKISIPEPGILTDSMIEKEILSKNIKVMFRYVRDILAYSYIYLLKPKESGLYDKTVQYEDYLDNANRKVVNFISGSDNGDNEVMWLYLKMSDEIESISDHTKSIAKIGVKMSEDGVSFTKENIEIIRTTYLSIFLTFNDVCINKKYRGDDIIFTQVLEKSIRAQKRKLME